MSANTPLGQTEWDEMMESVGYLAEDAGLTNPSIDECLECMRLNWSMVISPSSVNTYVVAKRLEKKNARIAQLQTLLAEEQGS